MFLMKSSCFKKSTFFITFMMFCKHLVKNCNVYLAGSIWILLSIGELLILHYIANIDPGSNPKYLLLCNATLVAYSLTWGFASRKNNIIFFLPTFLLPFIASMMEFANFSINMRFYFFSQLFHFFLLDIVWFVFCNIFYSISVFFERINKPLIYCQSLVEISGLWLMSSIIMNALLNGGINNDAIIAICQTNPKEAWHYFWGLNHGAILVVSLLVFLIIFFIFIYYCRKTCLKQQKTNLYLSHSSTLALLALVFFLCGIGWKANMYAYYMPLTYKTIRHLKHYRQGNEQFNKMVEARHQLLMQHVASHKSSQGADGVFVLIIGESLDRRYMGCYNPKHKTTPFQSELKNLSNVFFFPKIYACHVQTTLVVPMILTAFNQYIPNTNIDFSTGTELSLSLFDFAKSNGYSTCWISNQEKISNTNSIITSIAMSADQTFFIREDHHGNSFDHEILPYLEKINPTSRALIIIHLYGNHYPYGTSYPADFKFPADLDVYEKSVFYNDYVLHQFMDYFQSHGAMMVAYVSDHADAVSIGKGHDPRPNNFQKEMIEIPMWFWLSEGYRQQYPQYFTKLQASSHKVITNDLVFNMFMDLMQIQYTDNNDKYSPLSDNYILDTEPPKTLGGKIEIPNP